MLGQAVKAGDAFANSFLDTVTRAFAIGLSNIVSCLSPQRLAIGGGVSLIGEPLLGRVRTYIQEFTFFSSDGKYEVVPSELGEDVVLVGALLLAGAR